MKKKSPISFFSYPRGRVSDNGRSLFQQAGIEAAVTTRQGQNGYGADLMQLRRVDMGYCNLSKGFDSSIFEVELHGWFNYLR